MPNHLALLDAITALQGGDWHHAHHLAQGDNTPLGAWLHGLLHRIEGDEHNARYWCSRAQRPFDRAATPDAELASLLEAVKRCG